MEEMAKAKLREDHTTSDRHQSYGGVEVLITSVKLEEHTDKTACSPMTKGRSANLKAVAVPPASENERVEEIIMAISKKYEVVSRYGRWDRKRRCWV